MKLIGFEEVQIATWRWDWGKI